LTKKFYLPQFAYLIWTVPIGDKGKYLVSMFYDYLWSKLAVMETNESTSRWWLYFFISAAVIIMMLYLPSLRPWFWLSLPFVLTTFAKALKIM